VWCGVVWCGVVWCGVVWCGVVWCGVVWYGVAWRGVAWCGVKGAKKSPSQIPSATPTRRKKSAVSDERQVQLPPLQPNRGHYTLVPADELAPAHLHLVLRVCPINRVSQDKDKPGKRQNFVQQSRSTRAL